MTDRKNGKGDTEKENTRISSPLNDIAPAPEEAEVADVVFGETQEPSGGKKTAPKKHEKPKKPKEASPTPLEEVSKKAEDTVPSSQPVKKEAPKAQPASKSASAQTKAAPEERHSPAEDAALGAEKKNKNKPLIIACCSCLGIIAAMIIIILIAGVLTEIKGTSESGYLNGPGDSVQFLVESEDSMLTITFEYPAGEADFWVYVSDSYGNPVMDWWDLDTGTVLSLAGYQTYYVTIYSRSGSGDWSASW